ncbi:MAG: tetratricopeptide repeat protein [Phycisphaerae bacterium]|nr:tetratricopeptide repeat protein [Phycisphaerae bacterium]
MLTLSVGLSGAMPGCTGSGSRAQVDREPPPKASSGRNGAKQLDPAQTYLNSAERALQEGNRDAALSDLARAIEINPRLTEAHMAVADIYRLDGDFGRAEQSYKKAAEIEPRNFDAQFYHGLMLHVLDRVSEAIRAYLRALALRPDDFQANLNLSAAYFQLDENDQALPYAQTAVRLSPQSGPARMNLGSVFASLGRHREAVNEFQQATELMDLTPDLLLALAESLGKTDRYAEMRNTLEQLIKSQPSAAAYERLGFAQFKLKDFASAQASFERALEFDAEYFPAMNGIGVCLLNKWIASEKSDTESRDRAVRMLRRSLQANRQQPRILELVSRYSQ